MEKTPADWPRIAAAVFYQDPATAIDWLCRAFGFEVRLKIEGEGGRIEHSELVFGDGLIMVGGTDYGAKAEHRRMVSPKSVNGGNTQNLCVYVDDVDAHCARARAAGADIFREPVTDNYGEEYGSHRSYGANDPEGHQWFFMRRVRGPKPDGK